MPAEHQNGVHHGRGDGVLETAHSDTFLFTSESVGEGHPGKPKNPVTITMIISFGLKY